MSATPDKGILKKNTKGHFVLEIISKKGKPSTLQIPQEACTFNKANVTEAGVEAEYVMVKGKINKVIIPGEAEITPPPKVIQQAKLPGRQGAFFPAGKKPNDTKPARRDATAPFNFIPVHKDRIATGFDPHDLKDNNKLLYGRIYCSLKAITPLLVAEPGDPEEDKAREDANEPKQRHFFKVGNPPLPTIPGSSLKGLIRSTLEALSFAKLAPVSEGKVFYRTIGGKRNRYQDLFVQDLSKDKLRRYAPKVHAGYLERRGAEAVIHPCEYARIDYGQIAKYIEKYSPANQATKDKAFKLFDDMQEGILKSCSAVEKIKTWREAIRDSVIFFNLSDQEWHPAGKKDSNMELKYKRAWDLSNREGQHKGELVMTGQVATKKMEFLFYNILNKSIPVDFDVLDDFDFREQKTKAQEDILKLYDKNRIPVFYLLDEKDHVLHFGLAQLFRIPAKQNPKELSSALADPLSIDFCENLFGYAHPKESRRGRVLISHATFSEGSTSSFELNPVVPGQPSPTATAMYLEQGNDVVCKEDGKHANNDPDTFEHDNIKLRGRKMYWHHDADKLYLPKLPNDNKKVQAIYHPLKPGVTFDFHVDFTGLSEAELGGLLKAIELPDGHLHKLGLGKPFGLGSVHISIKNLEYQYGQSFYGNISTRLLALNNDEIIDTNLPCSREQLDQAFISAIAEKAGFDPEAYENQDSIKALRLMMDYQRKPNQDAIKYMTLSPTDKDTPSYKWKSILKTPAETVSNK